MDKELPISLDDIVFDESGWKIFLRPDHPTSQSQIHQLFDYLAKDTTKLVVLPSGWELIVVKKDGSAKVF